VLQAKFFQRRFEEVSGTSGAIVTRAPASSPVPLAKAVEAGLVFGFVATLVAFWVLLRRGRPALARNGHLYELLSHACEEDPLSPVALSAALE